MYEGPVTRGKGKTLREEVRFNTLPITSRPARRVQTTRGCYLAATSGYMPSLRQATTGLACRRSRQQPPRCHNPGERIRIGPLHALAASGDHWAAGADVDPRAHALALQHVRLQLARPLARQWYRRSAALDASGGGRHPLRAHSLLHTRTYYVPGGRHALPAPYLLHTAYCVPGARPHATGGGGGATSHAGRLPAAAAAAAAAAAGEGGRVLDHEEAARRRATCH
eukprot:scaffold55990_cov52-Phaeocystis_antarctica.AAC.1